MVRRNYYFVQRVIKMWNLLPVDVAMVNRDRDKQLLNGIRSGRINLSLATCHVD